MEKGNNFLSNIQEIHCWKCHIISKPVPDMDNYGYFQCSKCNAVIGKLTSEEDFINSKIRRCKNCVNFADQTGCCYGVDIFDSRCIFELKKKLESEYPHKFIFCPVMNIPTKCSGNLAIPTGFEPCEDCPVIWPDLRINFEIQDLPKCQICETEYNLIETYFGLICPDCYYNGDY